MKVLSGMLVTFVAGSMLFAADFSTKSNDELVSIAGSVAKEDIVSYVSEIENRVSQMSEQEAGEFKNKLEAQEKQAISAMSEKERAQYKQNIDEAIKNRANTLEPKGKVAVKKGADKAKSTINKSNAKPIKQQGAY